eukprot:TRINITY_DN10476_c4_g1_i1.p1 TRINITY_DN10476_c4_g1~~TRINITY_DN10476_c4_g1_i1.p1  ORF type:complete len:370 (+),score=43.61 TRINITY_DN10476_c4_g1_i1:51-1160(+)
MGDLEFFVGGLPTHVTESLLRSVFAPFGDVSAATVMCTPGGTSRGYGFICFEATPDEGFRMAQIDGKRLTIAPAGHAYDHRFFVGGLSDEVTAEDMTAAFAPFGEVSNATCVRGADGRGRGFGFVTFATCPSLELLGAGRCSIRGSVVSVRRCEPLSAVRARKLFVGNVPPPADDAELFEVFRTHGATSAVVRQGARGSRGFGFVEFRSAEQAAATLNSGPFLCRGRTLQLRPAEAPGAPRKVPTRPPTVLPSASVESGVVVVSATPPPLFRGLPGLPPPTSVNSAFVPPLSFSESNKLSDSYFAAGFAAGLAAALPNSDDICYFQKEHKPRDARIPAPFHSTLLPQNNVSDSASLFCNASQSMHNLYL